MLETDHGVATVTCHEPTGAVAGAKGSKVVVLESTVFDQASEEDD